MLKRVGPLLMIALLVAVFFYKLTFTDLIFSRGDTYAYFYPYWQARNTALMQGQLPLWTPDIFMGVPLLANPQLGTFYPPNWLTVPFTAPNAVRISILFHLVWAMGGVYLLARRAHTFDRLAALLAAVIFGLGGHLSAHVEQINQLQGLAWMPWVFLLLHQALTAHNRRLYVLLLGIALALQIFTGHTQTVFITLIGLGLYGLLYARRPLSAYALRLAGIMLATGLIALLLAVPQVLPTAELTGLSNRGGGLTPNQATAFSLSPLVLGRGLLPSYDGLLFGEYVAYVGIISLGLAITGAMMPVVDQRRPRLAWLVIALVGLLFALGIYSPVYWTLASLPGFNLFRVPARWLALFALGTAMLAGMGLQSLRAHASRPAVRVWAAVGTVIGLLVGASLLTASAPVEDITGPAVPTVTTFVIWGAALLILIVMAATRHPARIPVLFAAAILELFLAAQILPYNDLVPPAVHDQRRFTISQMRAYTTGQTAPGRFLSISRLLFDPGDKAALEARYQRLGLDGQAARHALVATKKQETLFPNLALTWRVPGIDGFDGGLLPTIYYSQFTSLMLPPDELRTVDGRLGEILAQPACRGACIPDQRWLNLTDTRYLITDKVYDLVDEGIFYDTGLVRSGESAYAANVPFDTTAVDVLYTGSAAPSIVIQPEDDAPFAPVSPDLTTLEGMNRARFALDEPLKVAQVDVQAPDAMVYAITLVDTRTGDFAQLTAKPYTRALSSDIKIYENHDQRLRAYVVYQVETLPDTWDGGEAALVMLQADAQITQGHSAIIHGDAVPLVSGTIPAYTPASIITYEPEQVVIEVSAAAEGYLILTDAYYPGWTAMVNGEPVPVLRSNVMFRAVHVPAGQSTVILAYKPAWLPGILIFGAAIWLAAGSGVFWLWRRRP